MSLLQGVHPQLLDGALTIVKTLHEHGHQAYFAGGAVRDLVLGREVSDIDIATSTPPSEVERLFPKTIPVGKGFGVVVVVLDSLHYEVTTFRRESDYADGRHPDQVHFTDVRQDARRRDFTVNALYLDPLTEEVMDYVEGRKDLKAKLIRTVGPPAERLREDKLRILRAARLSCQLGFKIEPETYSALSRRAPELTDVSRERIRDELLKILTGPNPAQGVRLLFDSGILRVILPEVATMHGVPQPPEFHPEGDVFAHTLLMFELSRGGLNETLAMGILLHDVGKPGTFAVKERIRFDGHVELGARMAEEISRGLRFSNEQVDEIVDLVAHHLRFIHVQEMRESKLKRFLRKENIEKHLELHRLDCLASHGDLSGYDFCRVKLGEIDQEDLRPKPLISGHDLIDLDLKPGPIFSEILGAVEDLQLEGQLKSREEALDWVRENYPDGAGPPGRAVPAGSD